ncbi:MAG TPA: rRNA maturation RNase YbeY [Candidatus Limnocylindria bacterium]|nr:rRNA maturation RNase YbeY [Candidatus Limnocylindria bacterium]
MGDATEGDADVVRENQLSAVSLPRSIYLPPWRIDLDRREGVPDVVPERRLARAIAEALTAAGAPSPASIGVILADDATLAELNRAHMAVEGPTDVLSFPLQPAAAFPPHAGGPGRTGAAGAVNPSFALPPGRRIHLGDIVVSVERAVAQAVQGRGGQTGDVRWSPADELLLLVTHGALHVCGWDHAEPAEEAAMRALERQLLGVGG